jgi:hypothetical protein
MRTHSMAVLLLFAAPMLASAQSTNDHEAVERVAMDYLEGFYEGDESKLRRGIHPSVTKFGFFTSRGSSEYQSEPMSFQEMIDYANQVKASGNHPPETAPMGIEILDVMDQTASAKVTAWWGMDYLHLAKYDGQWQIVHVLWQTAPPSR